MRRINTNDCSEDESTSGAHTKRGEESETVQRLRLNHCKTPQSVHFPKEVLDEDPTVEVPVKLMVGIQGRDNELIRSILLPD